MLLVNVSKHLSCEKATIFLLKNYVFLPLSPALSIFIPFSFLIKSIILSQTSSHDCYKTCQCMKAYKHQLLIFHQCGKVLEKNK